MPNNVPAPPPPPLEMQINVPKPQPVSDPRNDLLSAIRLGEVLI